MDNHKYLRKCEREGKSLIDLSNELKINVIELDCYFANYFRRFYKPYKIKPKKIKYKMTRDEFIKAWEAL